MDEVINEKVKVTFLVSAVIHRDAGGRSNEDFFSAKGPMSLIYKESR